MSDTNTIKIIQLNLHGGRRATEQLIGYIKKNKIEIALLQDFHQNKKTNTITSSKEDNFIIAKTKTNKAAIIAKTGTRPLILYEGEFTTAILIENNKEKTTVINAYAPPSADFHKVLLEIEHAMTLASGEILVAGDFNAHSQQWGYDDVDARGNTLTSFMLANSLVLRNPVGAIPSFYVVRGEKDIDGKPVQIERRGWPDLTMSSPGLSSDIHDWEVLEHEESLSDHRYIRYNLKKSNKCYQRHRLETKLGKHAHFDNSIKKLKNKYISIIETTTNRKELEKITERLQSELTAIAQKCYKMRKTPDFKDPSWWSPAIQTARNKLRACRRRFQNTTDTELRNNYQTIYKRERAKYKKLIRKEKTNEWKKMCSSATNNYGTQYKIASGKKNEPAKLVNIINNNNNITIEDTLNEFLNKLYITDSNFPHKSNPIPPKFNREEFPKITKQEINRIINNIKVNKAPGYDYIDYNLLKRIHKVAPTLMTILFNKCLELSCFPKSLKIGIVILFHKEGKDPSDPKNYRPICLLPALGKILERVLHGRINYHLYKEKYWSPLQFGFKQGVSTENALDALLSKINDDKMKKLQTLLVSFDIKGAFDSISWPEVIQILKDSPVPAYLTNNIVNYLEDRVVYIEENGIRVTKETYGGCPQGSCLGPLLWLLIAETALKKKWGGNVRIQAFADDFILALRAKNKEDLIEIANKVIKEFADWAKNYKLTINWDKTEVLYLNRDHSYNLPTADSYLIEGISYNNREIKSKEHIKYLGLVIDKNLSWQPHCQNQIKKIQKSFRLLSAMATRRWGLPPDLIKTWYKTVVERTLVYAAPVWGFKITKTCQEKLLSCQRQFALAITKAYKTAPTSAILVLSGLIPIHLQIKYEAAYGSVTRLHRTAEIFDLTYQHSDYTQKINVWFNHPADTVEPPIGLDERNTVIFTDGSKPESGATGSALVA